MVVDDYKLMLKTLNLQNNAPNHKKHNLQLIVFEKTSKRFFFPEK